MTTKAPAATAPTPRDEVAAAEAELQAADQMLTELRERVKAGEKVPDADWLTAQAAARDATLHLEGAQERRDAAVAREHADRCDQFRERAQPLLQFNERLAELITAAGAAFSAALDLGREQTQHVGQLARDIAGEVADQTLLGNEPGTNEKRRPPAEDRGVGWRPSGFGSSSPTVVIDDQAISGGPDVTLIADAILRDTARRYGIEPHRLTQR